MNRFYVYVYFRLDCRPFLVGKGKDDRIHVHQRNSKRGIDLGNPHKGNIIRSILSSHNDVPKIKVAENLTEQQAFDLERLLIKIIRREPNGPLVNMTDGGDGPSGRVTSPEVRLKQSMALLGRKKSQEHISNRIASPLHKEHVQKLSKAGHVANTGAKRSKESKAKMRAAKLGTHHSVEHCQHISESNKGKPPPRLTILSRAKMRAAKLGKKQKPEHVANRMRGMAAARLRRNQLSGEVS